MKTLVTSILTLGFVSSSFAANGFLPTPGSESATGGTLTANTIWTTYTGTPATTGTPHFWYQGGTSAMWDSLMTLGNSGSTLVTPVNRNSMIMTTGGIIDRLDFRALGALETDPLASPTATDSTSYFRTYVEPHTDATSIMWKNTYDNAFSPNGNNVWAGMAATNDSFIQMEVWDENLAPIDLTSVMWSSVGDSDSSPTISGPGNNIATTGTPAADLYLLNLGDGNTSDDFIGRVKYTILPSTADGTFDESSSFYHTVNGRSIADAPVVTIPEPSRGLLGLVAGLALVLRRRKGSPDFPKHPCV